MILQENAVSETATTVASWIPKVTDMAIEYAPKVLMALITLLIGFWIIGWITKMVNKALGRTLDESLAKFLGSIINVALKVMLLLSVASMFGVNTTSFVAILGALMVGVGMALNGTLGHLASGIMLMVFKPFKVGDLVDIGGGHVGTVDAINAFNTTLETLDNKRIIVANSNVTGNTITNISGQGTVGVELSYRIPYNVDIDKAREIILNVGKECPMVIDSPAQGVVVADLKDGYVTLNSRPFCNSENYWDTLFYMQEHVKKAFDKAGINMPMPQMGVHMVSQN